MNFKNRYNYPFWSISFAFILGIFFSKLNDNLHIVYSLFVSSFLILFFFKKHLNSIQFLLLSCLCFFALGNIRFIISLPKHQPNHISNILKKNTKQTLILNIEKNFKISKSHTNYKASVQYINQKKVVGNCLLSIKNDSIKSINIGDSFATSITPKELKYHKIPYAFEYSDYLKNQGITHQIWANHNQLIPVNSSTHSLLKFPYNFKQKIKTSLNSIGLSPKVLQITKALTLGDRTTIEKSLNESFSKAGIIHILAISGLHIGIIYWLLTSIFKLLYLRNKYPIALSIFILCFLWGFALFSGGSPSAIRATTMFSCFELSLLLMRRQHPINSLFIAVFLLLFIEPQTLFSVSFQFSVIAVTSIIIGVPKLISLWNPKKMILQKLWMIINVSLCAQIGLLPLSIYYFHQFPGLFLAANLPVMLVMPFILSTAFFITISSSFIKIPNFLITAYNTSVNTVIKYTDWIAQQEYFILKNLYISAFTVFAIYATLCVLLYLTTNKTKIKKWNLVVGLFLICTGFWEYHKGIFKQELWLLSNHRNTIFIEINRSKVSVHSKNKLSETDYNYSLKPLLGNLHTNNWSQSELKNAYSYKKRNIYIIDHSNNTILTKNDIIILTDSPKINLERLIENQKPKAIIATTNNYKRLIKKWKATCAEHKVAFFEISKLGSVEISKF